MRRIILIVAALVALVIIVFVVAVSLLNVNKFRPRIQAELESKLGRPVTLGELHLRIFPLSLRVDGLTIGQAPGWTPQPPFATAKEVYASAGLFSLLRGQPNIKDLTLDQPQIELIRNAQGIWNFSSIGTGGNTAGAGGNAPTPKQAGNKEQQGQGPAVSFNQLTINDGQVAVTDERTKSPRTVYNHIDLKVNGFAPGKQFDFDLAAHFPGRGKELLAFSGKAGPLGAADGGLFPVSGHILIQEVSLAGLNSFAAGAIPANTDGVLSGDAMLNSQGEDLACKGTLKLENAVIRGAKVNYPVDAQYDLSMKRKQDQVQIRSGSVKLGPTAVSIAGTMNSGVTPAALNLRLNTANASITELSRLASAFGADFNADNQVKGSVSADLGITGTTKVPQVQGKLSASSIQAQGLVLNNIQATASMNNGIVVLSPVTAGLFGGQGNGAISVDTRPAHPLCSVKTNLSGVDTNALLSALTSLKDTLYGSLVGNTDLSFAVGPSTDIARTMNGTLNFNVTNGQLKNINILSELSKVGRFLNGAPAAGGSGTALQKFSGTLDVRNGIATTNNLIATLKEGSLSAIGSLNLVNQGLNLHMTAVLAKSTSSAVGGTGIGGFLNTALANNQGELVVPVLVTGTTAHPVFAPDVEAIAKMKVNHLLPTTSDPSKLNSGIVGSVLGGILGQSSTQQKNKKQPSPLDSLFKQLGKKKQPQ